MSGFSADWLALREPVDHRSRSVAVRDRAIAALAPIALPRVVDLGCGSGSNLRALAPWLGARQSWRLVDYDPRLLDAARTALSEWADGASLDVDGGMTIKKEGKEIEVSFERADLACGVGEILAPGCDLVTASAFFDLVGADWIARFCADLSARGAPLYATVTYDGREVWRPPNPADSAMLSAFHAHQASDKGFGVAAGPRAHAFLRAGLDAAGWAAAEGESDWLLGPADAGLIEALAKGSAAAVEETGRVEGSVVADWLSSRARAEGCLVGHKDLFAAPYL
jgi:SAM-dependent methyltransferase